MNALEVPVAQYPSRWRLGLRMAGWLAVLGVLVSASRHGLWSAGPVWPVLLFVLCAVSGWAWQQQTAWPAQYALRVRFQRQRWWFKQEGDHQNEWQAAPARPAFYVLGMVGIPHPQRRGHVWVFRDECSADDWRRLMICTRFYVGSRG